MTSNTFEPKIVAINCNECSYGAADLAGTNRMITPPNIKIIRVPCTGRVDLIHVLEALNNGADGVMISGCLKGDCHYVDGNIHAERRIKLLKTMLDRIGFGGERIEIYFMSSSMAAEWHKCAWEFVDRVKKLGPNPKNREE